MFNMTKKRVTKIHEALCSENFIVFENFKEKA